LLLEAHLAVGCTFLWRGEFVRARVALEQSVALYQPQHQALTPLYGGLNPRVWSLALTAWALWSLGYPEQALMRSHEALHQAQEFGHSYSLVFALTFAAMLHLWRGDGRGAQERADAMAALSSEHGFLQRLAEGTVLRGEALIGQEQWAEGVVQVRQNQREGEFRKTFHLAWLARGYGGTGQVEDGLSAVAEALRLVEKNDERIYEAEVYRIKGELTLQKEFNVQGSTFKVPNTQHLTPSIQAEAEGYLLKAIEIAQKQQAKSLELRAVMSLAHLWQSRGKRAEAHQMLSEIYDWFTEGFDTKDLQEAQALLAELS
jgi:tetratricopeptide (TPR) repeat protein